jgi:uncharacterized protein with ParB-like and HNH nuclease domain
MNNQKDTFSIDAATYCLKNNLRNPEHAIIRENNKFLIPIYQRPYSWGSHQLNKLIKDLFYSFWGYEGNSSAEPIFIGTMQLSEVKEGGEQHIIDGQQRTTTFFIILKVLKDLFPDSSELSDLEFDWLRTEVNDGGQQTNFDEFISKDSNILNLKEELNIYERNGACIRDRLKNEMLINEFNIERFVSHILSQVYFVVIETKASLTKTLQIFDTINTTGMDLNAGDVFKIRMYEYLSRKNESKEAFKKISSLYDKIDKKNRELGRNITNIHGILSIYQKFLIAKYSLPVVLYSYQTTTFFDRLFETLFSINNWEYFRSTIFQNQLVLSLDDIEIIIDSRFDWENNWLKKDGYNLEQVGLHRLWLMSRYGKFWSLIFLFKSFNNQGGDLVKLNLFVIQLSKVYIVYSVLYQKSVNEISSFSNNLTRLIVNNDYDEVLIFVNSKLTVHLDWKINRLREIFSGNILYNSKLKNILCRLSALLEEDIINDTLDEIQLVESVLFNGSIDIEHIQSYNDENTEERKFIQETWNEDLNSIGNLVALEGDINRSIGNRENDKLHGYRRSKLKIVNTILVNQYDNWNLEKSKTRKNCEVKKLLNYLFEGLFISN